jgi:hypothetical protein
MADPVDPNTSTDPNIEPLDPAVLKSLNDFNATADKSRESMSALEVTFTGSTSALKTLSEGFVIAGGKLENIGNLASQDATKFGALTAAVLGAKESFNSFANVDTSRLSTFASQIGDMQNILEKSPAYSLAKKEFDETASAVRNLMMSGDAAKKSLGAEMLASATKVFAEAKNKIVESSKAMLVGADNALKLQNAFIQLTAQAGDTETLFRGIGKTFGGVGNDFKNLNNITAKYQDVMYNAMQATGIESEEVMAGYMATIVKMPGGFKELMGSMEVAGRSTNILTAAVQYATGAGRNQNEVFEDMRKAISQYGVSVQDALKFTANITAVSETLHAQIDDVRSALMGAADAFKFFAMGEDGAKKMTQGMTESLNQYVASLSNVGVPVQNALEMFKNYTSQIKDMNQAQQAFVSRMSGGPGGLMGGFQIDAMIKRGDFAGLQKKVEETIKKMTGPIVSFEDAQKSQTAAAQYTRQIQILQQSPLGKMARSREEAESLLESMRVGKVAEKVKDPTTILAENIEKGAKIEQLSYTELKEININTKRMRGQADLANLTTIQRTFAARTGDAGGVDKQGRAVNLPNQEALRDVQRRGMNPTEGTPAERALKELGITIRNLPMSIQSDIISLQESISSRNKEKTQQSHEKLMKSISDWKTQVANLPEDQKESMGRVIAGVQARANSMVQNSLAPVLFRPPGPTTTTSNTMAVNQNVRDYRPAGRQVAASVPTGTTGTTTNVPGTANRGPLAAATNQHQGAIPVALAPGSAITVNITGVCPHCGRAVHQSPQARIGSAASTATNEG